MTPAEMEEHILLLHRRQTLTDELLDGLLDRLTNNPPAEHLEYFVDQVIERMEHKDNEMESLSFRMRRFLADASDTGRTIAEVSTREDIRRAVEVTYNEVHSEIAADLRRQLIAVRQQAKTKPKPKKDDAKGYVWSR